MFTSRDRVSEALSPERIQSLGPQCANPVFIGVHNGCTRLGCTSMAYTYSYCTRMTATRTTIERLCPNTHSRNGLVSPTGFTTGQTGDRLQQSVRCISETNTQATSAFFVSLPRNSFHKSRCAASPGDRCSAQIMLIQKAIQSPRQHSSICAARVAVKKKKKIKWVVATPSSTWLRSCCPPFCIFRC